MWRHMRRQRDELVDRAVAFDDEVRARARQLVRARGRDVVARRCRTPPNVFVTVKCSTITFGSRSLKSRCRSAAASTRAISSLRRSPNGIGRWTIVGRAAAAALRRRRLLAPVRRRPRPRLGLLRDGWPPGQRWHARRAIRAPAARGEAEGEQDGRGCCRAAHGQKSSPTGVRPREARAAGPRRRGTGPSPSWPPGWNARSRRRPWPDSARSRRSW